MTQPAQAKAGIITDAMKHVAEVEMVSPETIRAAVATGTVVIPANINHKGLVPVGIGRSLKTKINANIGNSALSSCPRQELEKLRHALKYGADTVMDLSTGGNINQIRRSIIEHSPAPIGTVPMYEVLARCETVDNLSESFILDVMREQAEQGVDFMTVHCGLTKRGAEMAVKQDRVMGVVSRGGSMLARWMLENGKENPLLEYFDRLIDVCRQFNVTLSLGDGLRPGAGVDAGDAAQWEEVITLGRLAKYALEQGVQCMIEGPGHVPMNQVRTQIQGIKRLTNNAPLYVLGPLCCDSAPGYDHIAGAIGGALGVEAGVDFLCYLTPAEHLTLPNEEDVRAGVMASRVAAHVGEVALGRERAVRREATMNAGRKALDWDMMREAALDPQQLDKRREDHKHEDVCAMCGKFCAVKMLKDQKKD